jgi:UDP-N-acetylmuramyl pentapeptide synthase
VGGSNGKTTVKELIASVLRQKWATLWSEASFNNDIGVPLTLLRLEKSHQAAVLEAGTNHPGELAPLVKMIQPKYGVITNIGREHLEFFGDVRASRRKKAGSRNCCRRMAGSLLMATANGRKKSSDAPARRSCASGSVKKMTGARPKASGWTKTARRFAWTRPKAEFCGEYRVNLLGRHQVDECAFGGCGR